MAQVLHYIATNLTTDNGVKLWNLLKGNYVKYGISARAARRGAGPRNSRARN